MKKKVSVELELFTLGETACYLRKSLSYCRQNWPSWTKFGVRPSRVGGNCRGTLLFEREEIKEMVRKWKI